MIFNIVKGTSKSRAKVISLNECTNFYVENEDPELAKNPGSLIHTPGFKSVTQTQSIGTNRGIYVTDGGRFFTVVSNKLYEMSTDEKITLIGALNTSNGVVNFASNPTQLMIVDGTNGYIVTLDTNAFTQITDTDFANNPSHVVFANGYFIVNEGGSGRCWFSKLYDGTDWNAADFFTAEWLNDNIQGIITSSDGILWLIGTESVEMWAPTGNSELPWQVQQGTQKKVGCIAKNSIASDGDRVYFLGGGAHGFGGVFIGGGYSVNRISTPAIEYMIKSYSSIENATAFTYTDESHQFYVLSFNTEATLVYDLTTGVWHQRATYNTVSGKNIRQFALGYGFFNGKHYVGHYLNSNIYQMSMDMYDEDGNIIKRRIVTNHLNNENKFASHKSFELDFDRGIGMIDDTTSPKIVLEFSNDGGRTWSNESWENAAKSAGSVGEYSVRARWTRLGRCRDRVYRITCTDAVPYVITVAYIEVV